jgi:hypothetical protein
MAAQRGNQLVEEVELRIVFSLPDDVPRLASF